MLVIDQLFSRALSFVNAALPGSSATMLRVRGERIVAIGEPPHARDALIDLDGDWLLPGLINAHDHLELNNFPRLKWRERYANAREWIADFQPRFKTDPVLTEPLAVPLRDRLLIGGLKNLLAGITTVCHHNPLHRALRRRDFPVRVVQHYGWTHSLAIDGDSRVAAAYRRTRLEWPWIIHLAEGLDAEAASELTRLDRLGCLLANTRIVHGVGLGEADRCLLSARRAGLIWCPSSNLFLFGRTADVQTLVAQARVALGSDSRLSGERDLLDELRVARERCGLDGRTLSELVTVRAAHLLCLSDIGQLRVGARADLLVLPSRWGAHDWAGRAARRDVQLVMIGGRARYAAPRYQHLFALQGTRGEPLCVDGEPKWLEQSLATQLRRCRIQEPGVTLSPQ